MAWARVSSSARSLVRSLVHMQTECTIHAPLPCHPQNVLRTQCWTQSWPSVSRSLRIIIIVSKMLRKKCSLLSKCCYDGRLSGSPVSAKVPAGYFNTDLIALGTVGDGVSFPSDRIN